MTRPQRPTIWRRLRQRLCSAVTLVAYLAAAFGVPLPAGARPRDAGQPFPCQHHACGCRTAEQCWSGCCCFTPEQRWAWAEGRNVQPPAYAEKPKAQSWRTTRLRDRAPNGDQRPPAPCCQAPKSPTRPSGKGSGPSCRQAPPAAQGEPSPVPPAKKAAQPARGKGGWALGVAALRCQGHSTLWATTGAAPPPEPRLTWSFNPVCLGRLPSVARRPLTTSLVPPDPPPRPGCA